MKAVRLLIESLLPSDLQKWDREYSAGGFNDLLAEIARKYPDRYEDLTSKIADIGREASYRQGETLRLSDLKPVLDRDAILKQMDAEVAAAMKTSATKEEAEAKRLTIWGKYADDLEKATQKAGLAAGNNIAYSVVSGARGKPAQLKAMLTTPGIYADARGRPIPLFVRRSHADGLRPAEYLASTYGARSTVISTKACLHEATEVRMADFSKKHIRDIHPGEWVLGADIGGNTFPVQVVRVYDQGLQEVHRWSFREGNGTETLTLDCTEDHRVLMCSYRSNPRRKIKPQPHQRYVDRISVKHPRMALVLPSSNLAVQRVYEPWAAFLGLMVGDGCCTGQTKSLSCADPQMIEELRPYLTSLDLKIRKSHPADPKHFGWNITTANYDPRMHGGVTLGQQGFANTGASIPLNQKLKEAGCLGKYAWEKTLPNGIWTWDDYSVAAFIGGYFATDGCVTEAFQKRTERKQVSVSFGSTSRALLEELKELLRVRFCIYAGTISEHKKGGFRNSTEERVHPLYTITIGSVTSVRNFAQLIAPHTWGKKRLKLHQLAANTQLKQDNPYRKAAKVSSEYLGCLPCFDLEVNHPDHLFVLANGAIVSNSTAKGGDLSKQLVQIATPLVVTTKDCGSNNGIDLELGDSSLKYRVLAKHAGGYPAGTIINSRVLADLRRQKLDHLMVRSPMTCTAKEGICARCSGAIEGGKLPNIGDAIGITSAQAIGEPITQMALNAKHCLVEGTLVEMWDGEELEIQKIQVGHWVLASNRMGQSGAGKVTAVLNRGVQQTFSYLFEEVGITASRKPHALTIRATADHRVLTVPEDRGMASFEVRPISEIAESEEPVHLVSLFGRYRLVNVKPLGKKQCWDISIDTRDNLFVLANGAVVHNSGGVAKSKKTYAGFEVLNQLVQSPEAFPDRATVSEREGTVERIEDAPQGGKFIYINGEREYAPPGYEILVKPGDEVEAGEQLSDGIVDPRDVVKLRGLGEGRRYYAQRLKQALDDSGIKSDQKHTEMLARAAINHLRIDDPEGVGEYLPDDTVSYNALMHGYVPPKNTQKLTVDKTVGTYLQEPALHYTVGTKITKRMAKHLASRGFTELHTSDEAPGFEPDMERLRTASHSQPDWLAKQNTSYLTANLQQSAVRGEDTNIASNVHFAPRLAIGVGFGDNVRTTGKF